MHAAVAGGGVERLRRHRHDGERGGAADRHQAHEPAHRADEARLDGGVLEGAGRRDACGPAGPRPTRRPTR